jgi:hypothetical protein
MNKNQKGKIEQIRRNGKSYAAIADTLGILENTISPTAAETVSARIMQRSNLPPLPRTFAFVARNRLFTRPA